MKGLIDTNIMYLSKRLVLLTLGQRAHTFESSLQTLVLNEHLLRSFDVGQCLSLFSCEIYPKFDCFVVLDQIQPKLRHFKSDLVGIFNQSQPSFKHMCTSMGGFTWPSFSYLVFKDVFTLFRHKATSCFQRFITKNVHGSYREFIHFQTKSLLLGKKKT